MDKRLVEVRLLGQQAELQAFLAQHLARVRWLEPGRDAQQRRLARAVGTDQPDSLGVRDRRVDRIEDDERADLASDVRQPQDRHRLAHPGEERGRRRCPLALREALIPRAEVRAPRADDDASYRPTAARTRQTSSAVHVQEMLHIAGAGRGAVRVDRRAAALDALAQHGAQRLI